MDRDTLYRECALQDGQVALDTEEDPVERTVGGAWVTCQVFISNAEVSELLSQERKQRRLESAARHVRMGAWDETFGGAADVRELQDTPRRGDA